MEIVKAGAADLPEIFRIYRRAFQGEAQMFYGNHRIRPLRQTLAGFIKEAEQSVVLKAIRNGSIIGSITIRLDSGTCYIGSVIVHPAFQNQGVGTQLMRAAETYFPCVERFELFTGEKSARNLHFYQKLGYRVVKTFPEDEIVNLVLLEKRNQSQSGQEEGVVQ